MKVFLKYVGEFLRTYPQIRLNRSDEVLIRDETMNHLGLTNLNQMRDRYEGQAFFERTMMNYGGLIAIEKHLNLELTDIKKINLDGFHPKLYVNDEILDVLVFDFGTLPLIDIDQLNNAIFFVIKKDRFTFNLCGYTDLETIKNNLVHTSIERSSQANNRNFIGFRELIKAENLILKK